MNRVRSCGCFFVLLLALCPATVIAATHTLTINTNGSGTVARNPTNSVYPYGSVVTLTAMPSPGWMFTSWSGDATGTANPINVLMDTNKTVTAHFALIPTYTLTVSISGQGSVAPPGGSYQSNAVVSLTATPAAGWLFYQWSGDASGNANPLNVTMTADKSVTAVFVQPPAIVSQPQSASVGLGDTVTFSVGANGTPPLAYVWQFVGSTIPGATSSTLTISNVQASHVGEYLAVVSNSYGSMTSQVATLTITNSCSGSNVLTVCDEPHLRQAIEMGGTIRLCCNGTITLTNTIDVTNNVALDATGHNVIISGGNAVRLFKVKTNSTLVLTHLWLADGRHVGTNGANAGQFPGQPAQPGEDGAGGAIYNDGGTVRLFSCILSNNSTLGGNGGTYNQFNPTINGGGGAGRGGAVFNRGGILSLDSVMTLGCSVTGGLSAVGNPAGTNGPGLGGAVSSVGGSVFITNSLFSGNRAATPYGARVTARAYGGGLAIESALLMIAGSVFVGNRAVAEWAPLIPNPPPGSAHGGALSIQSGTAMVNRCQFSESIAQGGEGFRHSGTGEGQGGGIYNLGFFSMADSAVSMNQALAGNYSSVNATGKGGGLYNGGTAYLNGTTFDRNVARGGTAGSFGTVGATYPGGDGNGGAIFNAGALAATNCTLALNESRAGGTQGNAPDVTGGTAFGGAVYNGGGMLDMMNVTIASNFVVQGYRSPPSQGANVANTNGSFSLRNSLVAHGVGSSNAWGTISDGGFNMSSDGSCNFNSGSSFNFTDPRLGPLANNGGSTLTMALQPDSPAIDFGTASGAPATDQRGFRRPFGTGVDMGAYEAGPPSPTLYVTHSGTMLEISFTAHADVSYELLRSIDLRSWERQELIGTFPTEQEVSRLIMMTEGQCFFRLQAE